MLNQVICHQKNAIAQCIFIPNASRVCFIPLPDQGQVCKNNARQINCFWPDTTKSMCTNKISRQRCNFTSFMEECIRWHPRRTLGNEVRVELFYKHKILKVYIMYEFLQTWMKSFQLAQMIAHKFYN